MSCQALEDLQYIEGDIQSDTVYSPPPPSNQNINYGATNENFIALTSCNPTSNNLPENYIASKSQHIELNSSSYMNGHQTHQMLNQNPVHYQDVRSDSTSSIPLSNRQYSPSNKQYYQSLTPPYTNMNKNYIPDDHSDSLNKSSNTNTNKRDDLLEFELLEQQVNNMQNNSINNDTRDHILTNNTDYTAQEILNAAATPIANISQYGGEKKIKMKPTLKKNYMSLEQLQMKCQINAPADNQNNSNPAKNDLYNINSHEMKSDIYNLQRGSSNSAKVHLVSDTTDQSDIFNKYNLANSESIDQQSDSLQHLLERAFKSKQKYESRNSVEQNIPQPIMSKPPPPIQLEKQILSTLPPPSPINVQNISHSNSNTSKQKDSNNKIQLQFSNILESLKKTNSTTTIVSSQTTGSKSNSQQNCSTLYSKSGNKTPTSVSNLTALLYQNDGSEKILVEGSHEQNFNRNLQNANKYSSLSKVYTSLGEFNQNIENQGSEQKPTTSKNYDNPQIGKSQSHASLPVYQQRSISVSTAQDYARILNRRRSSSRRMSSKGSIGSVDSKGKPADLIQKEIKELNAFFSNLDEGKNQQGEPEQFTRSMSNQKIPLKSTSDLFLRLNQDLERRRVIQQEQLKQKEFKSKQSMEEIKKQNISRGKLSKDEEKNLVNKLFDDANRRQNIQVMQQKMKKIEEEQREKSLEAQRESMMKRNNSTHNNSQYANVQSKIKSIIESKPNGEDSRDSHSQNRMNIVKHSYSKKNQNRTISPILKRTQKPLQTSDSKTQLNKTQMALQQFQHNEKRDNNQYNVKVSMQAIDHQSAHHQQTKSATFMENLQFQFYTPAKPLTNENRVTTNKTLSKDMEGSKSTKQLLNNSTSSKQSYLKQLSNQRYKMDKKSTLEELSVPTPSHHKQKSCESKSQTLINTNVAPPSVSQMKKHMNNMTSTLRTSHESVSQQKKLTKNDSFVNKENGSNSKSLSRKPKITINIDEDEQQSSNNKNSNQINGLKHLSSITPSNHNNSNIVNLNHQNSNHNSSTQQQSYVSMKCTNSFFREKNPSTLSTTNQNFLKINRQMQYQFTSAGNQTSKNSSVNQSQQQSMRSSLLYPCKTPNNQSNNNGAQSNNKKSTFSFVNQSETSMDDQQFFHGKQSNGDTIKINIAQNKAQILENNIPAQKTNFVQNNQQQFNQQNIPQKQEKLDNINKFISENPNFIQFMMQQYSIMQTGNNNTNNFNLQQQQMQMNPMLNMNNFQQQQQQYQQQQQQQQQFQQQQQILQYYNQMNQSNQIQQSSNKQNKILTVDDLLDLDAYNSNNENMNNCAPLQNSPEMPKKQYSNGYENKQKSPYNLISMSEIDQNPINLLQSYESNNSFLPKQQQQIQQQQNSQLNYQSQNMQLEDQSGKSFGSFQNFGNSSQKIGKNVQMNGMSGQNLFQFKSGNSLDYQENEAIEQNFQSINNLNNIMKSTNTIPSSNYIGNNISSNSAIEQNFANLAYLQKSNQQFMSYNN